MFVYLLQVREVLAVIVPFSWPIVPGVGNVTNPYNAWLEKYVATADESLSEDDYLDQLVADYVGHSDLQKPDEYTPGVLQLIEQQNKVKANHIKSAAKCLTLIVFMLISLGIIAYI